MNGGFCLLIELLYCFFVGYELVIGDSILEIGVLLNGELFEFIFIICY